MSSSAAGPNRAARDVRGLLSGPARMSEVAQVRKDVRAVMASSTRKHEPTRMEENLHLQEHDVEILQVQEKRTRG